MSVTVFSKPACVQCTATIRALKASGVHYEVIDISSDRAAYDKVVDLGYRSLPVVMAGDTHWSGFQPDQIAAIQA